MMACAERKHRAGRRRARNPEWKAYAFGVIAEEVMRAPVAGDYWLMQLRVEGAVGREPEIVLIEVSGDELGPVGERRVGSDKMLVAVESEPGWRLATDDEIRELALGIARNSADREAARSASRLGAWSDLPKIINDLPVTWRKYAHFGLFGYDTGDFLFSLPDGHEHFKGFMGYEKIKTVVVREKMSIHIDEVVSEMLSKFYISPGHAPELVKSLRKIFNRLFDGYGIVMPIEGETQLFRRFVRPKLKLTPAVIEVVKGGHYVFINFANFVASFEERDAALNFAANYAGLHTSRHTLSLSDVAFVDADGNMHLFRWRDDDGKRYVVHTWEARSEEELYADEREDLE